MKSQDQIKKDLQQIAKNQGLGGEAVDLLIDLEAYRVYEAQINSVNTSFQKSLDRASGNGAIQECVDLVYSVFRGICPRIHVEFTSNKILSIDKFGELYASSNFKVFSTTQLSITPGNTLQKIDCIVSKERVYSKRTISQATVLYLDILENDLSEDCLVKINGVIVPTTRIFSDHSRFNSIFTLTLPGYGVRLIKKSGFKINDVVEFIGFRSIDLALLNSSELGKISIEGTMRVGAVTTYNHLPPDTSKSLLVKANESMRVDSIIKSNSDVSYLFNEVFINKILDSITVFSTPKSTRGSSTRGGLENLATVDPPSVTPGASIANIVPASGTNIKIYYVPVPGFPQIDPAEASEYIDKYKNYYVTKNITIEPANEIILKATIKLVTNEPLSSYDLIYNIFKKYSNKLNVDIQNTKIVALLNKLSQVDEVQDFSLQIIRNNAPSGSYVRSNTSYVTFLYDITYNTNDTINN